jgi:hypothetical protein
MNGLANPEVKCAGYITDGSHIDFPVVSTWTSGNCPKCGHNNVGEHQGYRRCNICWTMGAKIANYGLWDAAG